MSKVYLYITVIVLLAGCEKGNPVSTNEAAKEYFPLAQDNTWIYEERSNFSGHDTLYNHIVELDSLPAYNGIQWFHTHDVCPVTRTETSTPLRCAQYSRQDNRVIAEGLNRIRFAPFPPVAILDFPLYVGKSWTIVAVDTTTTDGSGNRTHIANHDVRSVIEVVTLTFPFASNVQCMHISDDGMYFYRYDSGDGLVDSTRQVTHSDEWFAPGIGLVRQVSTSTATSGSSGVAPTTNSSTLTDALQGYSVRLNN